MFYSFFLGTRSCLPTWCPLLASKLHRTNIRLMPVDSKYLQVLRFYDQNSTLYPIFMNWVATWFPALSPISAGFGFFFLPFLSWYGCQFLSLLPGMVSTTCYTCSLHQPPDHLDAHCLPAASLRTLTHQSGCLPADHCQASQIPTPTCQPASQCLLRESSPLLSCPAELTQWYKCKDIILLLTAEKNACSSHIWHELSSSLHLVYIAGYFLSSNLFFSFICIFMEVKHIQISASLSVLSQSKHTLVTNNQVKN